MDAGEALLRRDPAEVAEARQRAKHTWPVIIGFTAGAGLGSACFAAAGRRSLGLPAGLALLALVMSLAARPVDKVGLALSHIVAKATGDMSHEKTK